MSQLTIVAIGATAESARSLRIALQSVAEAAREIVTYALPLTGAICGELARLSPPIVLVDASCHDPKPALDSMAAIHDLLPKSKIVAVGEAKDALTVVSAMRAGACDFLGTPLQTSELARLLSIGAEANGRRGKLYTFLNAKGGSGSTTLAVNLSLVLASISRRVALIDFAVPGNAALHLDLNPSFTVSDTGRNLHRLDALLLQGMMTKHGSGLRVMAGASGPDDALSPEQLATLLDVVTPQFEFVVVDLSTRLDELTRAMCEFSDIVLLVGQPDVASMWNAQRVRQYVARDAATINKLKLVLNRHRKTPGVSDNEFERASGCELVWTVPNQYVSVSKSITNGIPVAQQSSTELKEAFLQFARLLTGTPEQVQTILQEARNGKSLLERVASLRSLGFAGAKASA